MNITLNQEQAEVCAIALRKALEAESSITASLRIGAVLTHVTEQADPKGIRVIDTDGQGFTYEGAASTDFDDNGHLLVLDGARNVIAVFNSRLWSVAEKL